MVNINVPTMIGKTYVSDCSYSTLSVFKYVVDLNLMILVCSSATYILMSSKNYVAIYLLILSLLM